MSDETSPFTAYESPPVAELAPPGAPRREGPLRVPCIIAAILGAGGLVTGLMTIVGQMFSQQMQTAFAPPAGSAPSDIMDIQQQMQAAMNSIQDRFFYLTLVLILLQFVVAAALLIGAVQCLRRMPRGPRVLSAACTAAACYEIVRVIALLPMQLQTMSATDFYMELMFDSSGNVPAEVLRVSMMITRIAMYAGLILGGAWVLAKVLFYIYTVRRLGKPEIRAAFQPPTDL